MSKLPQSPSYTNKGGASVKAEFDEFARTRFALPEDGVFEQWDGTRGTVQELMDKMLNLVKKCADEPEGGEWVKLGETQEITREYHVGRTASGAGNRFFRYRGVLKTQPALLCAALMEPSALGQIDELVRHSRVLHNFPDGKSRLMAIVAEAGPRPLFYDRDDCALTTYVPPTAGDPSWYQVSVTVPKHFPSASTAVRNHTMVWGYRFTPVDMGNGVVHTRTTLISQTELFGWIPKIAVNMMVSPVLCAYLRKLEAFTTKLAPEPKRVLLESYGLSAL